MTKICKLDHRIVVSISGRERLTFLQDLITNDVNKVTEEQAVYACLLTPQGKFLHDFLMLGDGERLLLDCEKDRAAGLVKALKIYAMRAEVKITILEESCVYAIWDGDVEHSHMYCDPRHDDLGWRVLMLDGGDMEDTAEASEYDMHRIALAVPDGSRDMKPKLSTLLDHNIDLLNGISWDKGCYVGQEVTARMRYRGLVKKRLIPVVVEEGKISQEAGAAIINEDGRNVGELRSHAGAYALVLMKLDAVNAPVFLENQSLKIALPDYLQKNL